MSTIENNLIMESFQEEVEAMVETVTTTGVTREEGNRLTDLLASKAILTELVKDKEGKEDWRFWVNPKLSLEHVPRTYNDS